MQWALKHPRYHSISAAGRDLRALGYEVSARRSRPWYISPRDRLEIVAFARDYKRATGKTIWADVRAIGYLDALEWAISDRIRWELLGGQKLECCHKCHFAWEEDELFPYLSPSEREQLSTEHISLLADKDPQRLRDHMDEEMRIFAAARVPQRLLLACEADHRLAIRKQKES